MVLILVPVIHSEHWARIKKTSRPELVVLTMVLALAISCVYVVVEYHVTIVSVRVCLIFDPYVC
jgi:hypothetical protein